MSKRHSRRAKRKNDNNVPTGGNKLRFDCGQGGCGGGNKGEIDLIEATTLEGVTGEVIHRHKKKDRNSGTSKGRNSNSGTIFKPSSNSTIRKKNATYALTTATVFSRDSSGLSLKATRLPARNVGEKPEKNALYINYLLRHL